MQNLVQSFRVPFIWKRYIQPENNESYINQIYCNACDVFRNAQLLIEHYSISENSSGDQGGLFKLSKNLEWQINELNNTYPHLSQALTIE